MIKGYFDQFVLSPAKICIALDYLVGLVDKASASRAEDPGFECHLRRDFSGSNQSGTPVITLPVGWMREKVRSATSILEWQYVSLKDWVREKG